MKKFLMEGLFILTTSFLLAQTKIDGVMRMWNVNDGTVIHQFEAKNQTPGANH